MSAGGPSRQRSLKDRLKDGITQSWPRRRGSQGTNSVKGRHSASLSGLGRTTRSADGQGYEPADGQRPPMDKSRTAEEDGGDCNAIAAQMAATETPTRGSLVHASSAEASSEQASVTSSPLTSSSDQPKELRKPPNRFATQPPGTFSYTVDKNDTLTSVAARFETTPSELVKINRLVSRFVFPGQVLFVPEREKSGLDGLEDKSPDRDRGRESLNSNSSSGHPSQSSPKPGHAERIRRSPNSSPITSNQHRLPDDDDLDRECKEKFLKINVKHITDGAGVVSGMLLVTPNCVMFDPHVVDPLVKEHGVDTYGVIAPMDHVANAALFNDIAIMKVRNAPQQQQNLPQPKIYYSKNCEPTCNRSQCSDSDVSTEIMVVGQPCRSESQQAVKGSVSDKADLDLSEEDEVEEGDDGGCSISSCHSEDEDKRAESPADDNSEVFVAAGEIERPAPIGTEEEPVVIAVSEVLLTGVEPAIDAIVDATIIADERKPDADGLVKQVGDAEIDAPEEKLFEAPPTGTKAVDIVQRSEPEGSEVGSFSSLSTLDVAELGTGAGAAVTDNWWEPEQGPVVSVQVAEVDTVDCMQNGQLPGSKDSKPTQSNNRLAFLQFLPDGRWPLLSSPAATEDEGATDAATSTTARLRGALTRKNSSSDVQSKLKVLKRLSNPLWGADPLGVISGAPEKIKESLDLFSVSATLPRSASPNRERPPSVEATPVSPHTISGSQNPSLARSFLKDMSGGLFGGVSGPPLDLGFASSLRPSDGNSDTLPPHASGIALPSPNIDGWVDATKTLLDQRRGSSPEQPVCEAVNPLYVDQRRFSEVARMDVRRFALGKHSREDIRVEFKSEVTVDDKKDLFQNMDKLIPRPAKSCDDPPLYLRVRMGRPLNKRTPSVTPIMSYGKQSMRSEYWFSIPKDRIDELCTFFHHWAPGVYGDLNEAELEARGMILLQCDEDDKPEGGDLLKEESASEAGSKKTPSESNSIHRDWEIIKAPYVKLIGRFRRETQSSSSEFVSSTDVFEDSTTSSDSEILIPEMVNGTTEILNQAQRRELGKALPARADGYAWSMIFSASQHGYSLQSMYRKMSKYETPVLLVIEDTENNIFGALTSCTLRVSDHFYGTGEGWLFTFAPDLKVFRWTGENVFFIKGNPESLAIGAGEGLFGLWLDGDLYHGRSHRCKTYNNETLSSSEDFCVSKVEAWGFVEFADATDTSC